MKCGDLAGRAQPWQSAKQLRRAERMRAVDGIVVAANQRVHGDRNQPHVVDQRRAPQRRKLGGREAQASTYTAGQPGDAARMSHRRGALEVHKVSHDLGEAVKRVDAPGEPAIGWLEREHTFPYPVVVQAGTCYFMG